MTTTTVRRPDPRKPVSAMQAYRIKSANVEIKEIRREESDLQIIEDNTENQFYSQGEQ